jgi:cytochrome b subunit of formate dehydrogenase
VCDGGSSVRQRVRLRVSGGLRPLRLSAPPGRPGAAPDCGDCHGEEAEVAPDNVHSSLDCTDCHAGADRVPHPADTGHPDCAECHEEEFAALEASAHGRPGDAAALTAEDCRSCHGPAHALLPRTDPASPVNPEQLADTCGGCHANPALAGRFRRGVVRPLEAYRASVHARAVAEGNGGATCVSCHGAHSTLRASNPDSRVNRHHVAETCGACHAQTASLYLDSVHAQALAQGVREAPTCTDCHGEHRILSPAEKDSPVYATNIPRLTCGRCHGDLRLAEKYGLDPRRVPAYEDSFHGLALRAGAATVANCGSCHGVHDVLPSSDPRSHVYPDNLPATCGQCHPGAGKTFAIGTVHVIPDQTEHPAVRAVRLLYLWLIGLVVGGMLAHNGLDFWRKLRGSPRTWTAPAPAATRGGERMSARFRAAHAALVVSFALLVWTGFAFRQPEAWWASPLALGGNPAALRAGLHRAAAVALLVTLALHVVHLVLDRRARGCIAAMRPCRRDLRDLRERLAWALGRRSTPPRVAPVSYPEKLEYLALLWGIAVMAASGFALWWNDWVLRWLPKWVLDLAGVVHLYEAVLASLAILVWHFYFVIFDPVVYPMDEAWLTGRSHPGRSEERDEA